MKCAFCGYEFEEKECDASCEGCFMSKSCKMIKCPNCGYKTPEEAGIIKAFRAWRERKKDGSGRKS